MTPEGETLAKGIGLPDTARGKAALNPALTRNLIKGKTTRATSRQSKAPSSHLEGGGQVAVASARTKALIKITPSPPENATPPKGWKKELKAKSSSLTRKTKGGRPYKRLGSNNARRLLRAQGRQKKVRRTPSNCHQLPLAVRTVIQEKDNPTSNKGEKK